MNLKTYLQRMCAYPTRADLGWTCLALVLMTAAVGVVCGTSVSP